MKKARKTIWKLTQNAKQCDYRQKHVKQWKIWQNKQNNAKIDKSTKNNVESKLDYVSDIRHGWRAYSALTKATWCQDAGVMRSLDRVMKAKFEGHFVNPKINEKLDKLAM